MRLLPATATVAVIAIASSACDKPSNTGYTGTWKRGNERAVSMISIYDDGRAYRFRWSLRSADDKWKVDCDWDGACEEFFEGERIATYRFSIRTDPGSGKLAIECKGKVVKPQEVDIHYIDELAVTDDGLTLYAYTTERQGETFEVGEGPTRWYEKVSDRVPDPPKRRAS